MKVVVIGAGVVGMCLALALRREGAEVDLLDRATATTARRSATPAGWPGALGAAVGAWRARRGGAGDAARRPATWACGRRPGCSVGPSGSCAAAAGRRQRDGLRALLDLAATQVERFARAAGLRRGVRDAPARAADRRADRARAGRGARDGRRRTAGRLRGRHGGAHRRVGGAAGTRAVRRRARRRVRPRRSARAGRVRVGRVARGAGRGEGAELRGVAVRGVERDGAVAGRHLHGTGNGRPGGDRGRVPSAALLRGLGVRVPLLSRQGLQRHRPRHRHRPGAPGKLLEANVSCSPSTTA